MAMLRSALGRISRHLSGSSAAPSVMSRRGPEILDVPALAPLRPAEPWMTRAGPAAQHFVSQTAAAAATTRRVTPNLQGLRHFPVVTKGTKGVKWAEQKRFLSVGRKESAFTRVIARLDRHFGPRRQFIFVVVVGVSYFLTTTILHVSMDHPAMRNYFYSGKRGDDGVDES